MAKKTLQTFSVAGKITAEVNVFIEARDIYHALEKAKELKITDFIEPVGELNDWELVGFSYIGSEYNKPFKIEQNNG